MSDQGAEGWLREALPGLIILALVLATMVALSGGSVRFWRDDEPPRATTASTKSFEAPPPATLKGGETYVRTRVLRSGDLAVTHWIESSQRIFSVVLTMPKIVGMQEAKATQVRVMADGRAAIGPARLTSQPGRYAFLGALSVQVTYRLSGVVEVSDSVPDRGLARITALDATYQPASTQSTRTVVAREVLSLACAPPEPSPLPIPCGSRVGDGEWTVELAGQQAANRVIAQLTLDR